MQWIHNFFASEVTLNLPVCALLAWILVSTGMLIGFTLIHRGIQKRLDNVLEELGDA